MKNALILHGTKFEKDSIQSEGNWFPWLKSELETLGYKVFLPELPSSEAPNIETYWEFLHDFEFNEETVLIGHSSGATALLGILERLPKGVQVRKTILVAGFSKDDGWNCEALFSEQGFDWGKIRESSEEIIQIHSDDDPYVSLDNAKGIAKSIGIPIILYPDCKHFSVGTGGERFIYLDIVKDYLSG